MRQPACKAHTHAGPTPEHEATVAIPTLRFVWIPGSTSELESAIAVGSLEESARFDAKEQLPAIAKKNIDLAVDIAAMATDGGTLLYGVGEDDDERLTVARPIKLQGAEERISQVVASSIAEIPVIELRRFPCDGDPSVGYLLVVVPPSDRAPHQVIVRKDLRYYGRDAKGNRILHEGEVARLYERRLKREVDRERLLAEAIAAAPVRPTVHGYLHAFVRPVDSSEVLLEPIFNEPESSNAIREWLVNDVIRTGVLSTTFSPSLSEAHSFTRHGADMWRLSTQGRNDRSSLEEDPTRLADLDINFDGRGHLFCGRATDTLSRDGEGGEVIFESIIAGNLEALIAAMGALYDRVGYFGSVDVGVALTGLQNAHSFSANKSIFGHAQAYPEPEVRRTRRIPASALSDSQVLVQELLGRFFEASSGWSGWTPYSEHGS